MWLAIALFVAPDDVSVHLLSRRLFADEASCRIAVARAVLPNEGRASCISAEELDELLQEHFAVSIAERDE